MLFFSVVVNILLLWPYCFYWLLPIMWNAKRFSTQPRKPRFSLEWGQRLGVKLIRLYCCCFKSWIYYNDVILRSTVFPLHLLNQWGVVCMKTINTCNSHAVRLVPLYSAMWGMEFHKGLCLDLIFFTLTWMKPRLLSLGQKTRTSERQKI